MESKVYKQDIIRAKSTELRNIWQLYKWLEWLFNNLCNKAYENNNDNIEEYEEMMKQIKELVDYYGNQFSKISVTYNQMVPKINNQFTKNRNTRCLKHHQMNEWK